MPTINIDDPRIKQFVAAVLGALIILLGALGWAVIDNPDSPPTTTTTTVTVPETTTLPPPETTTLPPTPTTLEAAPTTTPSSIGRGPRAPFNITRVVVGDLKTTADGQVIADTEVRGRLIVQHNNVTVRRSRIWGDGNKAGQSDGTRGSGFFGIQVIGKTGFLVEDSDIGKAPGSGMTLDVGIQLGANKVDNSVLHNVSDGIQVSSGFSVTDTIIDNLWAANSTAHIDGIQTWGGSAAPNTVENNLIDCTDESPLNLLPNASLFFSRNGGTYGPTSIKGNVFLGGGYLLRIEVGVGPYTLSGNTYTITRADKRWGTSSIQVPGVTQN